MNKIYFGDNLEILREFEPNSIDLICTDPPFNSGRNYNIFLASKAQQKAFKDIWTWDDTAKEARQNIEERSLTSDSYRALDNALKGYDSVLQNGAGGEQGAMRAYLAFMGARLVELHRVLKTTGSIYLHCDPHASHYLKGVMDAIFGSKNFRNEIIWCYRGGGIPKLDFARKHDILLRYSKSKKVTFNVDGVRIPYSQESQDRLKYTARSFRGDKIYDNYQQNPKGKHPEDWWVMQPIMPSSKEYLGYPTQKPRDLYERIIEASSNVGDLVLDPFCGCGTTIDAAETKKRDWIGIDLTILALDPMQKRLRDRHGFKPSINYEIIGYPTNMQEVRKLVQEQNKRHDFANWAVTRLGLEPTPDVGDGGFDGTGNAVIWNPRFHKEIQTPVIAEVKTGSVTLTQVRAFCHSMQQTQAEVGIFITLVPISSGMRQLQEDMGTFEHNNRTYNRLQFWQIDEGYFENPHSLNQIIRLPWTIESQRKSERHVGDHQTRFV